MVAALYYQTVIASNMSNLRLFLLTGATALLGSTVIAGPLTEAHVTKIINKVQVVDPEKGAHAAALQETIKDEIELKTGVKSRSALNGNCA